jgi:acetyl esterase/lipase
MKIITLSLLLSILALTSALAQKKPVVPLRLPDTVSEKLDLIYATQGEKSDRNLHLDLYSPKSKGPHPTLLVVHGGGWIGGSKNSFRDIAVMLASRGYVVANVEYRLATEAKFPGAVHDIGAAVRWLRANAEKYSIDPQRIGAVGGSAGGHLVSMIATTAHSNKYNDGKNHPDKSTKLQAAVVMGAGVDQVSRVKEAKNQSIKNCVIFFGAEYHENPEIYAEASPITHVDKNTAPLLFLDGGQDNPGKRYVDMRPKLDAAGVANELVVIADARHGQWGREPYRSQFVAAMDTFFKKHLNN